MGISLQDATSIVTDNALRTQYGLILPPGARVAAYVRSTGIQAGDYDFLATNLVATLAQGLARVRAGLGDFVVCLPGHVESVLDGTTFSNALLAGTKIIGVGSGSNTPTFNFPATAASWVVNKADVVITGLRIQQSNVLAQNTPLAIDVQAADCKIYFNEFLVATNSSSFTTATIQASAGSAKLDISGNIFRTAGGGAPVILLNAVVDNIRICDNEFIVNSGAATGAINVTAACTGLKILRNVINNGTALSVAGITFSNVAVTGHCAYNTITVLSTGVFSAGVTGITVGGASNLMGFFQNFAVNDPNKSGLLVPAVDT